MDMTYSKIGISINTISKGGVSIKRFYDKSSIVTPYDDVLQDYDGSPLLERDGQSIVLIIGSTYIKIGNVKI